MPSIRKLGPTPPTDPDHLSSPGSIKLDKGKAKELFDDADAPGPSVSELAIRGVKSVGKGVILGTKMLNPFYWITSADEWNARKEDFRYQQNSSNYNSRYYPYTPDHPYDSWIVRLKYKLFGETQAEYISRQRRMHHALDTMRAKILKQEATSPAVSVSSLGLGTQNLPGSPFLSEVGIASSIGVVRDKISSLPVTPSSVPSTLPVENPQTVSPGWGTITTGITARNHPSVSINPNFTVQEVGGVPSDWVNETAKSRYTDQGTLIPVETEVNTSIVTLPVVETNPAAVKSFTLSKPNPFPFEKSSSEHSLEDKGLSIEMTATVEIVTNITESLPDHNISSKDLTGEVSEHKSNTSRTTFRKPIAEFMSYSDEEETPTADEKTLTAGDEEYEEE